MGWVFYDRVAALGTMGIRYCFGSIVRCYLSVLVLSMNVLLSIVAGMGRFGLFNVVWGNWS